MKSHSLTWSAVMVIGVLMGVVFAQNELPKKPFPEWSRSEAEAVINNSPWAKQQELRIKFEKETQVAAGSYSGVSSAAAAQSQTEVTSQIPVDFIFVARLRSALPVRQALVRLKALETDVNKMTDQQRAAYDTQIKGLLECPACGANYVVTLSSRSKSNPGADAVFATFKGGRLADLQRYVYLANERGERRSLVHFVPPKAPGEEAVFFFPRTDEKGAPLLTLASKQLLINLTDNQANSITNFKIDVTKLVLNGKVEF
ncbi:MAG TPA: hypothetical protein VF961_05685 [Pyrinomonadaceae bacterium]